MDTEKTVNKTLNVSSEEDFELRCTPCAKKYKTQEALHWCVDCREYLCSNCTACHNSFSQLTGHNLTKANIVSGKTINAQQIPTERCQKHPTKVIEMYCGVHDQVICTICTTIDHKNCAKVHYIPEFVTSIATQQHNAATLAALAKSFEQLNIMTQTLNKAINDVEIIKLATLNAIHTFRKDVDQVLDELERTTRRALEEICKTFREQWQTLLMRVDAGMQDIHKRSESFKTFCDNNSQQFVLAKMSKDSISIAECILSQLQPYSLQVTFAENSAMKSFLKQQTSFGDLSHFLEERKLCLYKVNKSKTKLKFKVKPKRKPSYHGKCAVCVLDSGDLLLGNNTEKSLTLFNMSTFAETYHCHLSASPRAVCIVTDVEAAASLNNKSVQFVSVTNKLIPTRIIKIDHECYGLSIVDKKMYITDGCTNLYVYALNGSHLKTINKDSDQQIFSCAYDVSVNNDKIYVADFNKGLLILDTNGQLLCKYHDTDLLGAMGVCTDGYGNVFVSGKNSHNVLQIGVNGNRLGELLNHLNGLNNPDLVKFDKKHKRIIVSNFEDYQIHIFHLQ